ncbi:putative metabolite transport protein [Cladobotryum mycophilum]|uniref:Metabolite transport protein n=1 Tax=Cladobotryum mycophilum TaxID=491253 RepID=A0ABR0SK69_9HYPO
MAGQGITKYLVLSIGIATIGSMQFGFHLAELNAPQDVITCRKKSISTLNGGPLDCIPMDEAAFATVSSTLTVGGLIGALAAGPFSSQRGRLLAMRLTALFYILGSLIETAAQSVFFLALGRFVAGIGAGASTVIVPLYISEVCPPDARGFFGFLTQISINLGLLITQTLGFFLSYGRAWRWILGMGACFAAVQGLGLMIVPETPAWLAAHGQVSQAQKTMQRIRGHGVDIRGEVQDWGNDTTGSAEEEGLLAQGDDVPPPTATNAKNEPVHLGFLQVVRDPNTRPAIIAVVGIMFVQQLCGVNSVIMYSVSLLADLLPISSALLTIVISLVNLGTTIACAPLPDRLGRKTCLMLSIVGQGSSAFVLALSIVLGFKIISALAVLFFVGFFAVGLGPVPFILASELVGQEAVGATQSWCLGANYFATFLVAQFFPIVNKALNNWLGGAGWVYFIFAALAAVSVVFVSWSFRSLRFRGATGN